MTEIRLEFFFAHPPERVWRALTESRLLATWFAENDLVPRAGQQFRMRPVGMGGLDGVVNADVIEAVEQRRLDMIWRLDDMHLGVTWQLNVVPGGTSVEVTQTGYLGVHGNSRRDALRWAYEDAFDVRLRDVLAGLADEVERASQAKSRNQRPRGRRDAIPAYAADSGPVDPWAATEQLAADPAPMIFEPPGESADEWAIGGPRDPSEREREREAAAAVTAFPAGSAQRSCVGVALLAVLLTACAVVLTMWFGTPGAPSPPSTGEGPLMATLPGGRVGEAPSPSPPGVAGSDPTGGPGASPGPGNTAVPTANGGGTEGPLATSGPLPSAGPGATSGPENSGPENPEPSNPGPGDPADLTVSVTASDEPEGYVVTVANPGGVPVDGWTVVLTIPGGKPGPVSGATVTRRGNMLTFAPVGGTSLVPARGSVSFAVVVSGSVLACTIDGHACG